MCLAIPGKVAAWQERTFPFAAAWIQFGGVRREVNMVCVPDAEVGDYVLVHAGVAIARVDPDEARAMLESLREAISEDDAFTSPEQHREGHS